jgi:hypothetical protein
MPKTLRKSRQCKKLHKQLNSSRMKTKLTIVMAVVAVGHK